MSVIAERETDDAFIFGKECTKSARRERKSTKVVVPSKVVQNSILLPQFARDHRQTSTTVSCLIQEGGVGYIKGKRSKRELDTG